MKKLILLLPLLLTACKWSTMEEEAQRRKEGIAELNRSYDERNGLEQMDARAIAISRDAQDVMLKICVEGVTYIVYGGDAMSPHYTIDGKLIPCTTTPKGQ